MYLLFTFLTLSTSGLYLYYCDKGDLFMKLYGCMVYKDLYY